MQKYIHKIDDFEELFEKLKFQNEKYGDTYSAIMFRIKDETRLAEFQEFLLKYLRISDTVFSYGDNKILVILENTTIRGAILLEKNLSDKIKEKNFSFRYYCAAIQGDYIETSKKLLKSLKKRLKKAKEEKIKECVIDL